MSEDRGEAATRRMEIVISYVLRIGVVVSVGIIAAGLIVFFVHHGHDAALAGGTSYHTFTKGSWGFPHTLGELVHALARGSGRGYMVLGVLILILTPVLRVAVSVVAFFIARDRAMVVITLFVLCCLVGSFFLGGGAS